MTNHSVYLGCLDVSSDMTISGENSYIIPGLPIYDSSLTYGAPYSDMSNVWLFKSDGISDASSILIKSNQTRNFIGDTSSSSDVSSYNNLYHLSTSSFVANVVGDQIDASGHPEAADIFINYLAYKALGSYNADVAFDLSSINALKIDYGITVDRACGMVNNLFSSDTLFTPLEAASTNNDKAGQLVYKWLRRYHDDRFQLGYKMNSPSQLPSSDFSFTDISVNFTGALTPATVHGTLGPSGILNALNVKTPGSGYTHGLDVSFTIINVNNQNSYDFSGALNSVGAAQLNGALNDNSGVQYPLEFYDEFDILLTIQSASGQLDVSGDPLTMNRTALLKMQITE